MRNFQSSNSRSSSGLFYQHKNRFNHRPFPRKACHKVETLLYMYVYTYVHMYAHFLCRIKLCIRNRFSCKVCFIFWFRCLNGRPIWFDVSKLFLYWRISLKFSPVDFLFYLTKNISYSLFN